MRRFSAIQNGRRGPAHLSEPAGRRAAAIQTLLATAKLNGLKPEPTASTGQLADSTHIKKLRYIENLYQHAEDLHGDGALNNALGSLNDRALADVLESWSVSIRNQPKTFGVMKPAGKLHSDSSPNF